MYTQSKFPVLEQHFDWYQHALTVETEPVCEGTFIAGINKKTGEIEVGSVFEFLAYKVQLFVIYKLISLYSGIDAANPVSDTGTDAVDHTMLRLFKRLPHVAPEYFERLMLVLSANSSENCPGNRKDMIFLLFPEKAPFQKSGFIHSPARKKQDAF